MRRFLDVDPLTLFVGPQRAQGADPWKLQRQIASFGRSSVGMPPIEVWEDPDGRLVIANGVTRATRIAKLAPGTQVRVEVTRSMKHPLPARFRVTIADVLP